MGQTNRLALGKELSQLVLRQAGELVLMAGEPGGCEGVKLVCLVPLGASRMTKGEEDVVVNGGIFLAQFQRAAESGDRFVVLAGAVEGDAERILIRAVVAFELDGATGVRDRAR